MTDDGLRTIAAALDRLSAALYTLAPGYDYPIARDPVRWHAVRPEDVRETDYGRAVILRATPDDDGWRGRLVKVEKMIHPHTSQAPPPETWVLHLDNDDPHGVHTVTLSVADPVVVEVARD